MGPRFQILGFNQPWIKNVLQKFHKVLKKQNLNLPFWQLFSSHLHCITYGGGFGVKVLPWAHLTHKPLEFLMMSTSRTRRKTGAPGGAERPPLRSAHRLAVHPRSEPGAVRPERGALPGLSGFRLLCLPRLLEGTLSEAQGLRSPEGGGGASRRGALRPWGESCWPSRPRERAAQSVFRTEIAQL